MVYYIQSYIWAKSFFIYKFTCDNMKVYNSEKNIWQKDKNQAKLIINFWNLFLPNF